MRRRDRHEPVPRFPIGPILEGLGAENVPTGFGWVKMRCPFHDDSRASATVNHDIDGFACHGCGVTGDGLKLLQAQLGLDFRSAIERASAITSVEVGQVRRKRRRSSELLAFARADEGSR